MLEGTQSNNDHLVGFSSYTMLKGMLRPQYQSRAITTHRVAQHGGQTGLLWWNSGTLFPVGFYANSRIMIRIMIIVLFKNEKQVLGGQGAHFWRIMAYF